MRARPDTLVPTTDFTVGDFQEPMPTSIAVGPTAEVSMAEVSMVAAFMAEGAMEGTGGRTVR